MESETLTNLRGLQSRLAPVETGDPTAALVAFLIRYLESQTPPAPPAPVT